MSSLELGHLLGDSWRDHLVLLSLDLNDPEIMGRRIQADRSRRAATRRKMAIAEEEAVGLQFEGSQYQNSGIGQRKCQADVQPCQSRVNGQNFIFFSGRSIVLV